jgi:hypothetical protein
MSGDHQDRNAIFTQGDSDGPITPSAGMPRRNVMLEDFGYEVPVESVPLPSGGVTYPPNSVLHGRDSVDIRSMTAKEEDVLTSRALIKKGTVISHLLNNCITTPGANADTMLSGDRNAVMVALRITGYGAGYNVEVACPSCGEKSKQEFDLSALEVKRLAIQPTSIGSNEFEFELPVTKKRVKFRFMTGRDEQDIMKMQERLKKTGAAGNQLVTQRLQYAVISIDGISDRTKLQMFIQNMPARDSLALRRFIDENEPGIDMSAWMECPHCFEQSQVRLPLGPSFFWPDA